MSPTVTPTRTATHTATMTLAPSVTGTPTITPTPTATARPGADITFVGLARSDDRPLDPIGQTAEGWPIYQRPDGYLFRIVVEAKPGPSRRSVGLRTFRYDADNPTVRPDLEMIVSSPLGDGSAAVCDNTPPLMGGVPAAANFNLEQPVSDAINDLSCRFVNGKGEPIGRSAGEACTLFRNGEYRFVASGSRLQFCAAITQPFGFPVGDTVVSVRVRDLSGEPGPPASFVVRVSP